MKKIATVAAFITISATNAALADCAGDIRALRPRVTEAKDDAVRQEARRLLEKAEKDDKAGRAKLCADAVARASTLLKPR